MTRTTVCFSPFIRRNAFFANGPGSPWQSLPIPLDPDRPGKGPGEIIYVGRLSLPRCLPCRLRNGPLSVLLGLLAYLAIFAACYLVRLPSWLGRLPLWLAELFVYLALFAACYLGFLLVGRLARWLGRLAGWR